MQLGLCVSVGWAGLDLEALALCWEPPPTRPPPWDFLTEKIQG